MIASFSKFAALGFATGALFFTACGDKSSEPVGVTIPDAPDAAIKTVISEFAQGNGGILWQAMPASYRRDVNMLAHLAGTKIDAELYDQGFALIGRLGGVVEKQQAFILGSALAERSEEEKAQFQQVLPALVGLLDTITSSDLASSAGLLSFDGQKFFDSTVSQIATYTSELSKLSGEEMNLADYVNVVVSVVESSDAAATLSIALPDQPAEEAPFSKVEGRWVPADMASEWGAQIAEAKANLEATSAEAMAAKKPQIMGVFTMVDGVLTQIEAAETQEQFDQAVQGAMMPLMGLMMMGQGMGGGLSAPVAP